MQLMVMVQISQTNELIYSMFCWLSQTNSLCLLDLLQIWDCVINQIFPFPWLKGQFLKSVQSVQSEHSVRAQRIC